MCSMDLRACIKKVCDAEGSVLWEALGISFPRSFFCFSQVAGVWTPTTLMFIMNNHHPQSPAEVTSLFPRRPHLPSCSAHPAQGRRSGKAASMPGRGRRGWETTEWDFESLLHVLARYPCPPCLPDPWCIIICSSQLFFRYMWHKNKCDWQSSRENSV